MRDPEAIEAERVRWVKRCTELEIVQRRLVIELIRAGRSPECVERLCDPRPGNRREGWGGR